MNRTTISQIVIGIVLAAVGVGLMLVKQGGATVSAQTTGYSSTWTAKKVLLVEASTYFNIFNIRKTGFAGLGVWEWEVAGRVGTKTFTETWTAPAVDNITFTESASAGCSIAGIVNTSQLMAGCHAEQPELDNRLEKVVLSFSVANVQGYSGLKRLNNGGAGRQATTSCVESGRYGNVGPSDCVAQSGAYSYQHFVTRFGNQKATSGFIGGGTLMPLVWTVTGTVQN